MKGKAVAKEPGKNWIEFGRTIHTFYASDRSHPRKDEILSKVRELSDRIKGFGYCPDLSCVLYDVDEEQNERLLLGHSEKMALAFGMMNVSEGKAIRIMKNLRICVDCHNFAKFVSQVYGREVLIRDKSSKKFVYIATIFRQKLKVKLFWTKVTYFGANVTVFKGKKTHKK
ncbi:putative pentatricopeptide repeat-containing protein at3g13770 mitochondrial [Phtheirospermum japonicum]|uniref:Putative pentatricopeptide repeat-containing protein at3g13770 mitochondrial n=1 Tax=Phtheirospermum japonicum TaxID=374723 RepID=A0A830CFL4_9LAMI|nr:putative pentatricopeptide repeat-containing protein at3g13770 mitochondrial [Phtheirospermum japonicum]